MTRQDFELIAASMRAVLDPLGLDNGAIAADFFDRLSIELKKRFPNMDLTKFQIAAGL